MEVTEPRRYYGMVEIAALLGCSRQRVQKLNAEGKMPPPAVIVDGKPGWPISETNEWVAARKKALAETPNGRPLGVQSWR